MADKEENLQRLAALRDVSQVLSQLAKQRAAEFEKTQFTASHHQRVDSEQSNSALGWENPISALQASEPVLPWDKSVSAFKQNEPFLSWEKPSVFQEEKRNQTTGQSVSAVSHSGFRWTVLSFFIPIVGLVLWLVWKKDRLGQSRNARNGFIAGLAFWFLAAISLVALVLSFPRAQDFNSHKSFESNGSSGVKSIGWNKAERTFTSKTSVVKIDKIERAVDFEGKPTAKIYVTLTNKEEEPRGALSIFVESCYVQQVTGDTSEYLAFASGLKVRDSHLVDDVRSNESISIYISYVLKSETAPIHFKFISDYMTLATYDMAID